MYHSWHCEKQILGQTYMQCEHCYRRIVIIGDPSRMVDWGWVAQGDWGLIPEEVANVSPSFKGIFYTEDGIPKRTRMWKLDWQKCQRMVDIIEANFEIPPGERLKPHGPPPVPIKGFPRTSINVPMPGVKPPLSIPDVGLAEALMIVGRMDIQQDYCHLVDAMYTVLIQECGSEETLRLTDKIRQKKEEFDGHVSSNNYCV